MQKLEVAPGRWNLDDVLPPAGDARLTAMIAALERSTKRFESLRGRLGSFTREDLQAALRLYEGITEDIARTTARSYMEYSTDTEDQQAKARMDKAEDLRAETENRVLFFKLWWIGLGDSEAARLVPEGGDHRYFLGQWRKLKPHTLDEKVEQAVNLKNVTGFSSWTHHYDKIVSGFDFVLKVRGKVMRDARGRPRRMVVDEVTRLYTSPDGPTREAAYKAVLAKYAANGGVLGEVYRTIVRDWKNEFVKLRGYGAPISARNLENDVSDGAVRTLLNVCRQEASVFQDFFRAKSKLLGIRRMERYHIYAPLGHKDRKVSYAEAVNKVTEAFSEFDPRVARLARNVFQAGHVDSSPRKGKTNGAYCYPVTPQIIPYLFLNFSGVNRDVYTIAHESGHAVHTQLSSSHSVLTFQAPLVLAETASVFGEMILFDKFMREEKDPELKKAVLLDKLSSIYGTVQRQAYFVIFEEEAHRVVNEGATASDLCSAYSGLLGEQFGTAVEVPDEFKWEWTYIPHIYHTPFYCYAYTFGNLLSLALYDMYLKEGRDFVPRYLKLLSHGGSESPGKVLEEVGVDAASPKFWKSGFDVVRRMVGELRKL